MDEAFLELTFAQSSWRRKQSQRQQANMAKPTERLPRNAKKGWGRHRFLFPGEGLFGI